MRGGVLVVTRRRHGLLIKKVKPGYEPSGSSGRSSSIKRLGVFLLPPGWAASPSQGYPQH